MSLAAPSSKLDELEASRLIVSDKVKVPDTQVLTPRQLLEALRRRGLAFQFADICSFVEHERYVGRLMKHLTKPVLEGALRCTVAQIIKADRLVHVRLLEQGVVKPRRNAFGVREVEASITAALASATKPASRAGQQEEEAPGMAPQSQRSQADPEERDPSQRQGQRERCSKGSQGSQGHS